MPQIDIDGAASRISADNIRGQSGSTITIVSGHNLVGSGSGLTALPAANLTGTLPAISGANLTALNASNISSGTIAGQRLPGTFEGIIQFAGTQTASANANNLDDYEEGSWTPNLTDGSNNATHAGNNLGEYIKVGRAVFISCTLSTSSIGSVSGTIKCSGLPFTVKSGNLGFAVYAGSGGGMALSAGYTMSGNFNGNTTDLAIYTWDVSTGTSGMQHSEWGGGNTQMTFAGHYFTAS